MTLSDIPEESKIRDLLSVPGQPCGNTTLQVHTSIAVLQTRHDSELAAEAARQTAKNDYHTAYELDVANDIELALGDSTPYAAGYGLLVALIAGGVAYSENTQRLKPVIQRNNSGYPRYYSRSK
jgi:hypothetical protein